MKKWKQCGLGLALLAGLTPLASAQVPPIPGAVPPPGGAVAVASPTGTAVAATAPPRNIWSFLLPTPAQKAACKQKICDCTLGQLLNNSLKPASALTGGLIPTFCPEIPPGALLLPPTSAAGAAARIMADEAAAKERRAAVRYLGTVDCNYWPEAQIALINALRADRNVCVRLEAAWALARGCCCTKATMAALALTVEGSTADGNPAETSEQVRAVALAALENCLATYYEIEKVPLPKKGVEPEPRPEPRPEPPPRLPVLGKASEPVTTAAYYQRVRKLEKEQVVAHARRAVKKMEQWEGYAVKDRSLLGIVKEAAGFRDLGLAGEMSDEGSISDVAVSSAPARPSLLGMLRDGPSGAARADQMVVYSPPPAAPEVVTRPAKAAPVVAREVPPPVRVVVPPPPPPPAPRFREQPAVPVSTPIHSPYGSGKQPAKGPPNRAALGQPRPPQPRPAAPAPLPKGPAKEMPREQLAPVSHHRGGQEAQGSRPGSGFQQMARLVRTGPVEDRVWAVERLSVFRGYAERDVIAALLQATRDASPAVREAALRELRKMNARTPAVLKAARRCLSDGNASVRQRARELTTGASVSPK